MEKADSFQVPKSEADTAQQPLYTSSTRPVYLSATNRRSDGKFNKGRLIN